MAMKLRTTSLQFKMLAIMGVALAVALVVSIFSLSRVYSSITELDRISREDFAAQQTILQSLADFKEQVQEWKNVLLRGKDAAERQKYWAAFEKEEKQTASRLKEARSGTPHEKVRGKLEEAIAAHKAAGDTYRKAFEAYKTANDASAGDAAARGVDRKIATLLGEASTAAQDIGAESTANAVKAADRAYVAAIVAIVITMILALVGMALYLRRAVVAPIREAMQFAGRIEKGDLTAELRSRSGDEIGQLMHSLQKMKNALGEVVSQVRSSADAVVVAAGQVSMGTTDLSQRTEEQASSLEETAASMEELASTVKQNADNAKQADELARNASKRAEQGGSEVVRVVGTMTDISTSAKRIADIISVIDGIAFQTNILALNAAVEAARAGEQGRGFAVVAAEVRSLAQRSAQAAKEIKQLIGNSVEKVENGTRLVEQAGDTIQALVIDVQRVSELMASIAEASEEQSRGVQQVNKTVTEMDKVVQQNASVVQQSSAAAEGMRQQADALVQAVSTFRLSAQQPAAAAAHRNSSSTMLAQSPSHAPASTSKMPARKAAAATVPATMGDDWEEF